MNGWWENWRVRCGWMYYAEKCPEYGLFRLKTPPYQHVKKSAIFYLWRILNQPQRQLERLFYLSFNDNSPQLIHTLIHIIHILLSFFDNSHILFDIPPYHIWYTVSISRTYRHICTLYADVIINAYGYGGNGRLAISKKVLPNVCFWRYTIATRLRERQAARTHSPNTAKGRWYKQVAQHGGNRTTRPT